MWNIGASVAAFAAGMGATAAWAESNPAAWSASADEVRAVVAEMMADAATRSSLLQSGATAGHDGKFFLASSDGAFRLNVGGQVQTRYMLTFRDDDAPGLDDFDSGFTMPRTALEFHGHIFEPSLLYRVSTNYDRATGTATLEDAYAGYAFENGLIILWGQLRMPVLWEDMLWEKHSLAVDQSVVNAVFGQGRSQGVWMHYAADAWRMWFGFDDGLNSANTDITAATEADWAFTSRWELKFAGEWSQFDAFSSAPGSEFGAKLGVAGHYQGGPDVPATPEANVLAYTADLMFAGDGWNFFAQGLGVHVSPNGAGAETDDFGVVVQGGVFLGDKIEVFGRWDAVIADQDRPNDDMFNEVTAGMNYYLHGQAAKFTFDVAWFMQATTDNDLVNGVANGAPGSNGTRLGLLPSTEDNQFAVRMQFQLLF